MKPINKEIYIKTPLVVALFVLLGLAFYLIILSEVGEFVMAVALFAPTLFMILFFSSELNVLYRKIIGAYALSCIASIITNRVIAQTLTTNMTTLFISGLVISVVLMLLLNVRHAPAVGVAITMIICKLNIIKILTIFLGICIFTYLAAMIFVISNDKVALRSE